MYRGIDSAKGTAAKHTPSLHRALALAHGRKAYSDTSYNAAVPRNPGYGLTPTPVLPPGESMPHIQPMVSAVASGIKGLAKDAYSNYRHPIRRLTAPNQRMEFPGIGPGDLPFEAGKLRDSVNADQEWLKQQRAEQEARINKELDPLTPHAPRSLPDTSPEGGQSSAYFRALDRLHQHNPGFINYLNRQGSPEAEMLNSLLGARPVLRQNQLLSLANGFKRKQFVEDHAQRGDRSLPYLAGDTMYGQNRFSGMDEDIRRLKFEEKNPEAAARRQERQRIYGKTSREKGFRVSNERQKALNRVLFNYLMRSRN